MDTDSDPTGRFNLILYRQKIRQLGPTGVQMAREWCLTVIRREHPHLTADEVDLFYEKLITIKWSAVDEWTQRMS